MMTSSTPNRLAHFARLGYSARGLIYGVMGGLSFMAAFGAGHDTPGTKGAIIKLLEAPGGWLIVLVLAIGLGGYSAWRFCQGFGDADYQGRDLKAILVRAGQCASGATHAMLTLWAVGVAIGYASRSESQQSLVAQIMSHPLGRWLVGAAGLALIGAGIAQFAKGHGERFDRHFTWNASQRQRWLWFCKFGLYARGVIFLIVGTFILYAAFKTDPSEAGGVREALQWLRRQTFGPGLLAIIALGLMSFGVYSLVAAKYRRIQPPA